MRTPIPVKEAVQLVTGHSRPLDDEVVSLEESYGRVLAEGLIASHDVPPFNRSAYDGYAVRADDTKAATIETSVHFDVIGNIGAGHTADKPLEKGEAYRIMTGAALPENADAIVMLEDTTATEGGFKIEKAFLTDANISFQGEDAKVGEVLIEAGTKIQPGTVALLATFGYANVKVTKHPKVNIISTGTELLNVEEALTPGKIRNSNGPMLGAQLDRMGITYESAGMMEDNLEACIKVIETALETSNIVITTGGVSVGDFDYLPEIYKRLGAKVLFNKVMMRPGSVTTVAVLGDKLLFGLSGNPSACFTGFELFTRPAILSMMGNTAPFMPHIKAVLAEDYAKKNPFTRFIRAVWELHEDTIYVRSAGFNKTNAVTSIAKGNCLLVLPSDSGGYKAGMEVDILLLGQEDGVPEWNL